MTLRRNLAAVLHGKLSDLVYVICVLCSISVYVCSVYRYVCSRLCASSHYISLSLSVGCFHVPRCLLMCEQMLQQILDIDGQSGTWEPTGSGD